MAAPSAVRMRNAIPIDEPASTSAAVNAVTMVTGGSARRTTVGHRMCATRTPSVTRMWSPTRTCVDVKRDTEVTGRHSKLT